MSRRRRSGITRDRAVGDACLLSPEALALRDEYHARMAEATADLFSGLRDLDRTGRLCNSEHARAELQRVMEDSGAAKYLAPYLVRMDT